MQQILFFPLVLFDKSECFNTFFLEALGCGLGFVCMPWEKAVGLGLCIREVKGGTTNILRFL